MRLFLFWHFLFCVRSFFRSFCLFWWTVELQHFMVSDISELCLISVCWHIIIMLVAEEAAGCTSWLWSHRVQRHGFSSAQNWVGGVCQTSGWSRLENTEELQPATAAKAISNSRKVFFFIIVYGHRCYIVNKVKMMIKKKTTTIKYLYFTTYLFPPRRWFLLTVPECLSRNTSSRSGA